MKTSYLIRLDDACEYRNVTAWDKMENILDNYEIKPLVGVIPNCKDKELIKYGYDKDFWSLADKWQKKGWAIALHGYDHVYCTDEGGINPVNARSEFAGVDYNVQSEKIRKGLEIFLSHGLAADAFFAPSHTFDENTLKALKNQSNIRVISDCVANYPYYENGFYFIPQQTGKARKLCLRLVTICMHPNIMSDRDFEELESFLSDESGKCIAFHNIQLLQRKKSLYDKFLQEMYFTLRKVRSRIK